MCLRWYTSHSLVSPVFLSGLVTTDNKATFLVSGFVGALVVGFFEELGWTGFAIPRLRLRYGMLVTGLIVGVLWGAWRLLPPNFWAARVSSGELPLAFFVTANGFGLLGGQLLAFRLLMVWVSAQLQLRAQHRLVTTGPYAWVAHPLYTAMFGMGIAFALVSANWCFVLFAVLMISGLLARVPKEEQMMIEEFGAAYQAYRQRTSRFFPK